MKRKKFASVFVVTLAIALVLIIGAHFMLPHFLAYSLSKNLGVPVDVGGMRLSFRKITVHDIAIHNPAHSTIPYAFKVGTLEVNAPLREYLQPHVNINDVNVVDNSISVEFYTKNRKESNWTTILNHVNSPEENQKSEIGRTLHIDELRIFNTAVELKFAGQKARNLPPIKRIIIANIDPESGKLTKKLTRILTNHIVNSISSFAGIHGVVGVVLTAPATAVKSIFMPFEFLFGKKKKNQEPQKETTNSRSQSSD